MGFWFVSLIQGLQVVVLLTLVVHEMRAYVASLGIADLELENVSKANATLNGLSKLRRLTSIRLSIFVIGWIVFTWTPFLRRKFFYMFALNYLLTYYSGLTSVRSLWNFKIDPKRRVSSFVVPISVLSKSVSKSVSKSLSPTLRVAVKG